MQSVAIVRARENVCVLNPRLAAKVSKVTRASKASKVIKLNVYEATKASMAAIESRGDHLEKEEE